MKSDWLAAGVIFFCLSVPGMARAQDEPPPSLAGAPPQMLVLVHQEFLPGKAGERRKLEAAIVRGCAKLKVPNSWIDLQSLTGPPEVLSFDPFDSFEQVDEAFVGWKEIMANHPDIARNQEDLDALVTSERTIIAVRRDDLGYRAQSIDFSKARFVRVLEVRLNPGHESDFVEAFRNLGGAYERVSVDIPWVVYQVNVGMPTPAFLVFVPLRTLKQNDDLLSFRQRLRDAEGEEVAQRAEQIAREAYAFTESNLYAISPETSHVSREFAEGDPAFWNASSGSESSAAKPAPRTSGKPKPKE